MKFYVCEDGRHLFVSLSAEEHVPAGLKEVTANTTDAAQEKHVPVVEVNGTNVTVKVGSVAHPMQEAHFINWIVLETSHGFQQERLVPGAEPVASFVLAEGEKAVAAYEFCNLHGLWKASI